MAARLREDMEVSGDTSVRAGETGYTLQDLEVAGVYAAECKERLDNQGHFGLTTSSVWDWIWLFRE